MAPPLLFLALEFHRAPLAFRHLTDPQRPLPEAFAGWLTEASAALAPSHVDATAEAMGVAPDALRDAYLFLLRQMLLSPQADHYRVLGLVRGSSADDVKHHHGMLVRLFHPDRSQEDDERSASLTARINHAYQVLRDPEARRLYDLSLPPPRAEEGSSHDHAEALRPRYAIVPAPARTRDPARRSRLASRLRLTIAAGGAMALWYMLVYEPRQPLLRVNPDLGRGPAQGPSYMTGLSAEGGGQSREGAASAPGPGSTTDSAPLKGPAQNLAQNLAQELVQKPIQGSGTAGPSRAATPAEPAVVRAKRPEPAKPDRAAEIATVTATPPGRQAPEGTGSSGTGASRVAPDTADAPQPPRRATKDQAQASRGQQPNVTPGPPEVASYRVGAEGLKSGSPASKTTLPRDDQTTFRAASELVSRVERSFARGDLSGLVGLFTANAVVNGGVGAAGVVNAYSGLIRQSDQRRMMLSILRWRPGQHERLIGRGTIRIGTRDGPQGAWSETAGTLDIELVPAIGDYRIAKWIHHLSPQ